MKTLALTATLCLTPMLALADTPEPVRSARGLPARVQVLPTAEAVMGSSLSVRDSRQDRQSVADGDDTTVEIDVALMALVLGGMIFAQLRRSQEQLQRPFSPEV